MLNILIAVGLFFSVSLCSVTCKKTDSGGDTTKAVVLAQGTWKYDYAKIDLNNDGTPDMDPPAGTILACQADNTLTFNANGNGVVDEGATKCNTADPQTTNFTWNFTSNESMINFSGVVFAGITGESKIVTLNNTQLTLSKMITVTGFPTQVTAIVTFKH